MAIRISQKSYIEEDRSKLGKLLYRKLLEIGHFQWLYRNGGVHKSKRMAYYKGIYYFKR